MKRRLLLFTLTLLVFATSSCGNKGTSLETPKTIDNYQYAEYAQYNSSPKENGLGGNKVYVDGRFEEIGDDGAVYAILNDNGNKWYIGFGSEPNMKASYIENFKGQQIRVFGVYFDKSNIHQIPMLMCTKFTLSATGESHYAVEYSSFGSDLIRGWEDTVIDFGQQNNSGNAQTDTNSTAATHSPEPTPTIEVTPTPEVNYNPPTISLNEYNQLFEGMSYEKAVQIIGSGGELMSESSISGFTSKMYSWEGEGSIGANANALFQNGSLMSKSQFGLQ